MRPKCTFSDPLYYSESEQHDEPDELLPVRMGRSSRNELTPLFLLCQQKRIDLRPEVGVERQIIANLCHPLELVRKNIRLGMWTTKSVLNWHTQTHSVFTDVNLCDDLFIMATVCQDNAISSSNNYCQFVSPLQTVYENIGLGM